MLWQNLVSKVLASIDTKADNIELFTEEERIEWPQSVSLMIVRKGREAERRPRWNAVAVLINEIFGKTGEGVKGRSDNGDHSKICVEDLRLSKQGY